MERQSFRQSYHIERYENNAKIESVIREMAAKCSCSLFAGFSNMTLITKEIDFRTVKIEKIFLRKPPCAGDRLSTVYLE